MALSVTRNFLRGGTSNYPTVVSVLGFGESSSRFQRRGHKSLCKRGRASIALPQNFYIQTANFHHKNIIQFYIQTAHGILLEALQKSRTNVSPVEEIPEELESKIPVELKRLKAGSLRWLFQVWPMPTKLLNSSKSEGTNADKGDDGNEFDPSNGKKWPKYLRKTGKGHSDQLNAVVDYLKGKNIAIRRLIKLPWLLSADPEILEMSVQRVKDKLNLEDFHVAISFVNVSDSKLNEARQLWRTDKTKLSEQEFGEESIENRIDYLAYRLKCPKEDVSDMMARVNGIMVLPLEKIDATLDCLLLEGEIKTDWIVADPWVFLHNINRMRNRIHIIQEKGLPEFKPWVLRCAQRNFEKYLEKELEEMHLRGGYNKGINGFLKSKLDCDEDRVATIFAKVPSIQTASATKLNEMIDYLLSVGFTTTDIQNTPRVLGHKVETIAARLEELSTVKNPTINLHVLCKTSSDYRFIVKKWKSLESENSGKKRLNANGS